MRILVVLSFFLSFFSCKQNADKSEELASQIDILSKEVNENPLEVQPLLKRAKFNLNKKKHESSLFDLKQCLKIDSTNSECNYLAALCYFEISKYDKSKSEYGKLALRTIKNALSSDQNNLNYNMALETYNKLLKYDSFNSNTHYNIGFIHMELDLHNIAVNNFADAIYSNSVFYEAYYARGICFETLGNIAQAEVDYKRSIEINPDYKFAIDALENLRNNNKKYN